MDAYPFFETLPKLLLVEVSAPGVIQGRDSEAKGSTGTDA